MTLSLSEIERLEGLARAATGGPWGQFNGTDVFTDFPGNDGDGWHIADCDVHADDFSNYGPLPTSARTANAAHIAACDPQTILSLTQALRESMEREAALSASGPTGGGDDVRAALEWYGEQARLARLIHSGGDAGRHALAADGGKRAKAALSAPATSPHGDEEMGVGG